MASAMPTAGGLYFWTHYFASEKWNRTIAKLTIKIKQLATNHPVQETS
jgi:amino acid transporter